MITEQYTGEDLSGISGTSNRTLTLSNTNQTKDNGLLIIVDNFTLQTSQFSISHNASSSVITFLPIIISPYSAVSLIEYLIPEIPCS